MKNILLILLVFSFSASAQTPMSKLLRKHVSTGYDADAVKYFTKIDNVGGTLTTGEKDAVNDLVVAKKAAGTWAKDLAFYPMLGGTEGSCAVNLIDTSTYLGTFPNSATFSSTGVDWNGTSQYMTTGFSFDLLADYNEQHIMYYSMENVNEPAVPMGAGVVHAVTTDIELYNSVWYSFNAGTTYGTYALSTTAGVFINTRVSSTEHKMYQDGTLRATVTSTAALALNYPLYIAARGGGGGTPTFYTTMKCGMAAFGNGYTSTEVADETTALNTFITATGK